MNPARKFNAAATHTPYRFDYESEVAAFYAARPDQKGHLVFLDMTGEEGKVLSGGVVDTAKMHEELRTTTRIFNDIATMKKKGLSFAVHYDPDLRCVVLDLHARREGLPRLMGAAASEDRENVFVFDHEIGHAVCKHGGPAHFNVRECCADAYATIRSIQRFGLDETVQNITDIRAVEFVFRADRGDHFTSPVTQAILEDTKRFDFTQLDAQQTAELANRYALAHAMPGVEHTETLKAVSLPGKLPAMALGDFSSLRALAHIVLTTDAPAAITWGAKALQAVLDGKVLCDGIHIQPGKEWDDLRRDLAVRMADFAEKGPLFGISRPSAGNDNLPSLK